MAKELRISMAMGGGVSLGTFSGASLTQSLKLMTINAYFKGMYDNVVIDSFSGASAGAISLGIMFRALSNPDNEIESNQDRLEESLAAEFNEGGNDNLKAIKDHILATGDEGERKWKEILAIENAFQLQKEIWCNEINIRKLTGNDNSSLKNRHEQGLFYREVLENISKKYFKFSADTYHPLLLANRVLFACTLTSLNPLVLDARTFYTDESDPGMQGLRDPLVSQYHRDLRVFDINFNNIDPQTVENDPRFPLRWYRCHTGHEESEDPTILKSLHKTATWSDIATTMIACGCFPAAFKPVVLERYKAEYIEDTWPKPLEKLHDEIRDENIFNQNKYPFTYIDGGTFNNEPLREAFRMAYFLDNNQISHGETYKRNVLFVDPIVGNKEPSLGLDLHSQFYFDDEENTFGKNLTLVQLIKKVLPVFKTIHAQSRVNEADKAFQKRDGFRMRRDMRKRFIENAAWNLDSRSILNLYQECKRKIDLKKKKDQFPSVQTGMKPELNRVYKELTNLMEKGKKIPVSPDEIDDFVTNAEKGSFDASEEKMSWFYTLLMLSKMDIMLDMEGIDENAGLLSISPYKLDTTENDKFKPYILYGGKLSAFSGFLSKKARENDFEQGRRAAIWYLLNSHEINIEDLKNLAGSHFPEPYTGDNEDSLPHSADEVNNDMEQNIHYLTDRLKEIVTDFKKDRFNWFWRGALKVASVISNRFNIDNYINEDLIKEMLYADDKNEVELRITGLKHSYALIDPDSGKDVINSKNISVDRSKGLNNSILLRTEISSSGKWNLDYTRAFGSNDSDKQSIVIKYMGNLIRITLPNQSLAVKTADAFNSVLTLDMSYLGIDESLPGRGGKKSNYEGRLNELRREGVITNSFGENEYGINNPQWRPGHHLIPADNERIF